MVHNSATNGNDKVTETSFSPPRQLAKILIDKARSLQVLPDVAIKAIAIAEDPDSRVKSLVNVVAQDVKLTTDIVSLSNSSMFGVGQPIAGLQQAITRVGFRQTKNMILASSIASMMQKMDWHEIRVRDLLCHHSFLTAVLNSRLNSLFKLELQGDEFTAGLVHDIGRTLLAISIPTDFDSFDKMNFNESHDINRAELEVIGTSHSEVGAWFMERNHLPESLITVARFHHNPQDATQFKRLVAVTAIADDMANFLQRQSSDAEFDCTANDHLSILEDLGVKNATELLRPATAEILMSACMEVKQLLRI
ncbi:MAG: HD-like signal output (HDOD) protein [Mariniblastus sp.]|jgi:HD-like signal output (HDOD) protein